MDPHHLKLTVEAIQNNRNGSSILPELNNMEREQTDSNGSTVISGQENDNPNSIDVASLEGELNQSSKRKDHSSEGAQNQLVLYDPSVVGGETVTAPEPVVYIPPIPRFSSRNSRSRVLPGVGCFTVQCANCYKWRLIPTKEKYEEIREHILEQLFYCVAAREWRPEISCDDPPDITQDNSRLWAIDKPSIKQPPPGWQRLLRIRAEGGTKFADVYYKAPSGKRLRSMIEIDKYLLDHPELMEQGVTKSQFSFQIPRPLQANYVRKRSARSAPWSNGSGSSLRGSLEPVAVNPISWAHPDEDTSSQLGFPGFPNPFTDTPFAEPGNEPKRRRRRSSKQPSNGT